MFNETTAFSVAGLGLMIPGIILYHYFVIQEEKSEEVNLDNLVNTIWTEAVQCFRTCITNVLYTYVYTVIIDFTVLVCNLVDSDQVYLLTIDS